MEGEGRKRKGERDTHCSRREARKKLEKNGLHDNNWNIQCLFRKDSAGLNSADGCTDSYCTHIYRSKTHTHIHIPSSPRSLPLTQCDALHLRHSFPLGNTPLQAVFLTLLSHFFIRSQLVLLYPLLFSKTSRRGINTINIKLLI